MALYAFDGTWNEDEDESSEDTNVVKFRDIYAGADFEYLEGVGTRHGVFGRVFGGVFGAGGRTRIDEMHDALEANWNNQGDRHIDIIGFSRGSALAVHFANRIVEKGIRQPDGSIVHPDIRFLGIWDLVAAFGFSFNNVLDFQDINLGWDIDTVGPKVKQCYHALALDERRESFNVTRLDPQNRFDHVHEVWFHGVHSDVGGGNGHPDRSNIALQWMLDCARQAGVPLNEARAAEPKHAHFDARANISENKDPKLDDRRKILPGDVFHSSTEKLGLAVGESHLCTVIAKKKYNWSSVHLEAGARYQVTVPGDQKWIDGGVECGPTGWTTQELGNWFKEKIVKMFEDNRRVPDQNWFCLIGTIDDDENGHFPVGDGVEFNAEKDGFLYLFANDLKSKYGNNEGSLRVQIERLEAVDAD